VVGVLVKTLEKRCDFERLGGRNVTPARWWLEFWSKPSKSGAISRG